MSAMVAGDADALTRAAGATATMDIRIRKDFTIRLSAPVGW
jgi:hypothetical protein